MIRREFRCTVLLSMRIHVQQEQLPSIGASIVSHTDMIVDQSGEAYTPNNHGSGAGGHDPAPAMKEAQAPITAQKDITAALPSTEKASMKERADEGLKFAQEFDAKLRAGLVEIDEELYERYKRYTEHTGRPPQHHNPRAHAPARPVVAIASSTIPWGPNGEMHIEGRPMDSQAMHLTTQAHHIPHGTPISHSTSSFLLDK